MFRKKDIITAIEIGTSKIDVLVGEIAENETISVIGNSSVGSAGAVVKGEIVDMDRALELLVGAIEEADNSCNREINNSRIIVFNVTGNGISSYQGAGNVFIQNEDLKITEDDIKEAVKNAQTKPLPLDQSVINTFDSYFLLDDTRQISNPLGQKAHKLEAYIHVIHGDTNRIENFRSLLFDAGFDQEVQPVFSGMASVFGILTDEEKDKGVLLVDIGAGTTEYVAVFNMGVVKSGVLPIGFEHVANDLSLGLDLHISICRKILLDGSLAASISNQTPFFEIKNSTNRIRKIPLSSFERIIKLRLEELFELIKNDTQAQGLLNSLTMGGIITGGGALFPNTQEIFQEIFNFPVREGKPYDVHGALTGLESPRYATLWGMLKYGELFVRQLNTTSPRGILQSVGDSIDHTARLLWQRVVKIKQSIKF